MIAANNNFESLGGSYLFTRIAARVKEYRESGAGLPLIRMDIGDVSRPLASACRKAIADALEELGASETFKGYGPERGYEFLRREICLHDYQKRGIDIAPDEIFVGDGAKPALGALGDILSPDASVAMTDPGYPVYRDVAVMEGRKVITLSTDAGRGFLPQLPEKRPDIITLCYPCNPTGVCMSKDELQKWVDYAAANDSLIIYDSAYEAYIRHPELFPRSIYECEGADRVAIEVRSFSKTAGFTGIRCGYTVVPFVLMGRYADGKEVSLNALWNRRQSTKFNGASYLSQVAAAAVYSPAGEKGVKADINYYMDNAGLIRRTMDELALTCFGGTDSPYVWMRIPEGYTSEQFFELLLTKAGVSTTPGSGFGSNGEGYLRLTGFNTREKTEEAMSRFKTLISQNY